MKDPVCDMEVGKDSPHHTEYEGGKIYFCSEHCLTKFQENPSVYRAKHEQPEKSDEPEVHAPPKETDLYTCPMHPEVLQDRPGSCPKCGMALEPEGEAEQEGENPELAAMRRRFWVSLVLTLPVFIMAMGDLIPGNPLARLVSQNVLVWLELLLATPVVFRNAEAIEVMRKIDTLVVDKTGTLTEGKPKVLIALRATGAI